MVFKDQIDFLDTTMLLHKNIKKAIEDYKRYARKTEVLDDVSDDFIYRLAEDALEAKKDLRKMLRKSLVWSEELQSVVINGKRTHDPDYDRVFKLANDITQPWREGKSFEEIQLVRKAINYFAFPEASADLKKSFIDSINQIAPNAYRKNRKKSRIFKSICDALGVTDESAGSNFQKLFAKFADEINGKKIDFKLFLSINPAHFLTMSNPKLDSRGEMLTSCHSFNNTEYNYNNGCSGYARDDVTMIAFTVDNPDNPELLNNRKTTRQLFMYRVGNGLLLQSRMYNSSGGVYGASELTPLYRDLVQRELSALEEVPNLWKTYTYCKGNPEGLNVLKGYGFGGYADWLYSEFDAKISIRADHKDDFKLFDIGTFGLCIGCGAEISDGLYCDHCAGRSKCEKCGEYCDDEYLHTVHDYNGEEIDVCCDCFETYFSRCDCCEEYYPAGTLEETADDEFICTDCFNRYYSSCDDCGEIHHIDRLYHVYGRDGCESDVCGACFEDSYVYCWGCRNYVHVESIVWVHNRCGEEEYFCDECAEEKGYIKCDECGEYYHESLVVDGICPECARLKKTQGVTMA